MTDNIEEKINDDVEELLPCPFCGRLARIVKLYGLCGDSIPRFSIECAGCEIDTPMTMDKDAAIKTWNTRTKPKEQNDQTT